MIDLNPTPDQRQVLASVGKLLQARFAPARLRGHPTVSPDLALLPMLAEQGVLGLGTAESVGGAGCSIVDEVLLFELLGQHLVSPAVLGATIGARVALEAGDLDLATAIVAGRQPVCVAMALRAFDAQALPGLDVQLLDASEGALALLWNDDDVLLLRAPPMAVLQSVTATDRSAPLHRMSLGRDAMVYRRTCADSTLPQQANLLVAAQLLGMAQASGDMAVAYAGIRQQFGQPIGAFQAIKHRCADMAIRGEVLRAQLAFAALALRDGWSDAHTQVDACRLLAARTALANARGNIQVHGGIGFTAECDAHLYLLRAHLLELLGGPLTRVAQRLAGAAPTIS